MATLTSPALAPIAAIAMLLAPLSAAHAFSPQTQVVIAREAVRLAPPDLARQIEKHRQSLAEGTFLPFHDRDRLRHVKDADGTGTLDQVIAEEVELAIAGIEAHRPFSEIIAQLGVVSHFVADANNPLNVSSEDPREGDYFADYLGYVETALPRFPLVYYGLDTSLDGHRDVSLLVGRALRRGRGFYPLLGKEYRRIGFAAGSRVFDDRSTAFGVASLAFSHAVNDVAQVFRYIWLRAGGADDRSLPRQGERLLTLPRITRVR